MMFAEKDLGGWNPQTVLDQVLDPELVSEPGDHRFPKHFVRAWKCLHAGQQKTFKLDERFFKEDNVVQFGSLDASGAETKIDGVLRKFVVVFLACETFFFCSSNELTIPQQSRSGIMKITGNSEYLHFLPLTDRVIHRFVVVRNTSVPAFYGFASNGQWIHRADDQGKRRQNDEV